MEDLKKLANSNSYQSKNAKLELVRRGYLEYIHKLSDNDIKMELKSKGGFISSDMNMNKRELVQLLKPTNVLTDTHKMLMEQYTKQKQQEVELDPTFGFGKLQVRGIKRKPKRDELSNVFNKLNL